MLNTWIGIGMLILWFPYMSIEIGSTKLVMKGLLIKILELYNESK